MQLRFRHRIGLLVSLAALALLTVAATTLVLGQFNERQLSSIEDRYVPLIELDRDLKTLFSRIVRSFEDAASAGEEAKLQEADQLEQDFLARLRAAEATIADNGGDARALETELNSYYGNAREISATIISGGSIAGLAPKIEIMRQTRQVFQSHLDAATSPNRRKLSAAFAAARSTQKTSLQIDIAVAAIAFAIMAVLSWRIIRRTVTSLHSVSEGVQRLAQGDFAQEIDVPPGDELGDLAREANRTAVRLREYRERSENEDWIKSGLSQLNEQLAGEMDLAIVAGKGMRHLATYLGATAAAVYTTDEHDAFRRLDVTDEQASDAFGTTRGTVHDREVRVDRSDASRTTVVPLLFENETIGILELAMGDAPSDRALELMARVRTPMGTAFHVAESRARERELLVETQRQASAAQTANKELEAFSYSVSHDLRAPLRGIDGFSQALLEDYAEQVPQKGQEYLRRIRAAAQRMAELIDDLLRLSRVSRADFRRDNVDVSAIATTVITELRRANAERAVTVRAQSGVTAFADARLIRITLENLLGNAWKFTAKTEDPVIEFGARDEGERVYYVRDNGAGFDMKYADRLFGAFQRLHTDKEFPGTGIGLATVHRIVSRHGGRVWVDAEVGRGATFQFTLPNESTGASST